MSGALNEIRCLSNDVESLIKLNQESYIREDDNLTPKDYDWSLDKQMQMFKTLMSMRDRVRNLEAKIKPLY